MRTSLSKYIKLGDRIRVARLESSLSQKALASKAGIQYSTYSNYENGNRDPSVEELQKIALALNINLGDLIGWPNDLAEAVALRSPNDYVTTDEKGNPKFYYYRANELQKKMNAAFENLNEEGQQKAVERVEELTEIPKYQKKNAPEQK